MKGGASILGQQVYVMPCRALQGGLEMLPHGFRLLPIVPIDCYERTPECIVITSIFAAVETNPADRFSIGALGEWLPPTSLMQQVDFLLLLSIAS